MATISVANGHIVIRIEGLDRLYVMRSRIEVYLDRVLGARLDDGETAVLTPDVATTRSLMGTLFAVGDVIVCDVRDPGQTVTIDLDDERFRRLVVGVDAPATAMAVINRAVAARRNSEPKP